MNMPRIAIPTRRGTSQSVPRRDRRERLRQEDQPWEPKNILTFDGGGIRGYYSLLILQSLMNYIKHLEENFVDGTGKDAPAYSSFAPFTEPPNVSHATTLSEDMSDYEEPRARGSHFLPCHYFDYICGTSTGALISIMLSHLRMTVDDCLKEYANLGTEVFGSPRLIHQTRLPLPGIYRTKYDSDALEKAITSVTSSRGKVKVDDKDTFRTGEGLCKTIVFAFKQQRGKGEVPHIFRSYDHMRKDQNTGSNSVEVPLNPGKASTYYSWEVALAATAAQTYFAPHKLYPDGNHQHTNRDESETFIDAGGGSLNNPSVEALMEVVNYNDPIGTFVSIGTGKKILSRIQKGLRPLVHGNLAAAADPEVSHAEMEKKAEQYQVSYYRFNKPNALDMEFDEWKPKTNGNTTLTKIKEAFNQMLHDPAEQERLRKCAEELVRRRRLRTDERSKWERFSLGAHFHCSIGSCLPKRWYDRDDFDSHVLKDHRKRDEKERKEIIKKSRDLWKYKPPPMASS